MSLYLSGNYFCLTDKGKVRKVNEDSAQCAVNAFGNVFLVIADGMGGATKGDIASSKLVNHLIKAFRDLEDEFKSPKAAMKWLNRVIDEANTNIYKIASSDASFKGMGTTLSACLIIKDNLITAQVGDSRIYRLGEEFEQISVDQTYVNYLINVKKLSPKEANSHPDRHKITNAVGTKPNLNVDINLLPYRGERLLLCSDGLYNNVPLKDMIAILKGNDSLDKKCMQLIAFGNANGGSDNRAVIIWEATR